MRNLKKVLSLVLCVAMMLSVMVMSTGATSFTDEDKVSDNYAEAVEVLTGMGVIKGDDNNAFRPQDSITRAEVSTLIYRAATADVNNGHPGLTAGANLFTDVSEDDWFAGYVNYCADAEYVKGYEDNTFRAANDVTGYEVLAMILRAVGYDKNNEFTGLSWTIQVASTATKLNMLENLDDSVSLAAPATREVVAELIFQAIQVDKVDYIPALGYQNAWGEASIGEDEFGLALTENTADVWGRPSDTWNYDTGNEETVIEKDAMATYTVATTECDIAEAVGLEKTANVTTYTNGEVNEGSDTINPLATTHKLGAQGQLMELYDADDNGKVDTIVYIDTLLASVVDVKDATFDANGHTKTEATIVLKIYDGDDTYTQVTETNGETNYTYSKDDMVLVNAVQYSTDRVRANDQQHVDILNEAPAIQGTQTRIWNNADQHTINGDTYMDNNRLHLDPAGDSTETYTWYFDNEENLLGNTKVSTTTSYGVLTNLYWDNTAGKGAAYADITYMDGSSTSSPVEISSIDVFNTSDWAIGYTPVYALSGDALDLDTTDEEVGVSMWSKDNAELFDADLYAITTNSDGSLNLAHVDEMTDATIVTGRPAISGTASRGSTATSIITTTTTQYLIQTGDEDTGYTYTPVTGNGNVEDYTKTAIVDYVLENGRVVYAFIKGDADSATSGAVVYIPEDYSWNRDLVDNDTYQWNLTVQDVKGDEITVSTRESDVFNALITAKGAAVEVTYTDGLATAAAEIIQNTWATKVDVSDLYGDDMYVYQLVNINFDEDNNQLVTTTKGTIIGLEDAVIAGDAELAATGNTVYVLLNGKTMQATTVWVSDTNPAGATSVKLSVGDDAYVSIISNNPINVVAGETVTNVALYNVGNGGAGWLKDSYTVNATSDKGDTWTVKNVQVEGNIMTFDLVAPTTTVSADSTVTLYWS